MTIEYMREKIAEVYPGVGWKVKCRDMPDNQVVAIYRSFIEKGLFNKKKRLKKQIKPSNQINMFDYAKTIGVQL